MQGSLCVVSVSQQHAIKINTFVHGNMTTCDHQSENSHFDLSQKFVWKWHNRTQPVCHRCITSHSHTVYCQEQDDTRGVRGDAIKSSFWEKKLSQKYQENLGLLSWTHGFSLISKLRVSPLLVFQYPQPLHHSLHPSNNEPVEGRRWSALLPDVKILTSRTFLKYNRRG